MLPGGSIHVNPAPAAIDALIEPLSAPITNPLPPPDLVPLSILLDPRFTLDQLADQFHTTIEAISLWMLQPDIQARIEIIETASIQRARIAAHRALPAVATACHSIITTFNNTARPEQLDPDDHARVEHARRNAETARRAGALLLRLARFRRAPIAAATTPPPASQRADAPAHPKSDTPQDLLALINSPEFQSALAAALTPNQSRAAQAAGVQQTASLAAQPTEDNHATNRREPEDPPTPAAAAGPPKPAAQLEHLINSLLQSRADLEPAHDRLITQPSTADAAIANHPP